MKEYLHCMYQALQMALLRRILSLQSSFRPLKFFHLGETNFPLKNQKTNPSTKHKCHSLVENFVKIINLYD